MMVKPPGDLRRSRILEVDNGVNVAGEVILVEKGSGAMYQSVEFKRGFGVDSLVIKTAEERSRAGTIKTLIVVKDPNDHWFPFRARPEVPKQ